ncbi:MAG: hypothetical protein Q7K42_05690 [Candidatus Diapherotrites archaeon]|nr:hypothetical protein [Candidatus Diapherotrites archaeon]
MVFNYSLIHHTELEKHPLGKQFFEQLNAYDKEIGETDLGPNGLLIGEPSIFTIAEGKKLVGWVIGRKTLRQIHPKEKSFVPIAVYVVPSERRKVDYRISADKLVRLLKENGFHTMFLSPDIGGLTTTKGEKLATTFLNILKKRGFQENEAYVADRFILNKKAFAELLDRWPRITKLKKGLKKINPKKLWQSFRSKVK